MMKRVRKVLGIMLSICLLCTILPADMITVQAAAAGNTGAAGEVTRLEWLKALTAAFEMSVEEDNYPDNYYSDIDASSADYYDIMLATEFGLVDVEAGDPLRPDDAATREFAAHTLNLCMGYLPKEDIQYTFSEASTVSYPDDIQICVDQGWIALVDGAFLPERGITIAEKERMIAAAKAEVVSTVLDPDHVNQYQVLDGVLVVPEEVQAALTNENELTFYDDIGELAAGDVFVVISGGLPIARRAVKVTKADHTTIVTVESVETEEAFSSLDVQGTIEADLSQAQAIDEDVSLAYIVGGTEDSGYEDGTTYYSLREAEEQGEEITAVIATKTIIVPKGTDSNDIRVYGIAPYLNDPAPGTEAISLNCKITDVSAKWDANIAGKSAYAKLVGKVTFSCRVGTEDINIPNFENPFVKIPIGVVGYFKPTAEGTVKGSISVSLKGNIEIGVKYEKGQTRLIFDFKKQSFTIQAEAEGDIGVKVAAGIDVAVIKAELYAKAGAKASVKVTGYMDGKRPESCIHLKAHLYASTGGSVSFNLFGIRSKATLETKEWYNEKNSPVKVAIHYEDGKPVSVCSRDGAEGSGTGGSTGSGAAGTRRYKYYTPINSQYAYSGLNTGTTSTGQPFTIFDYSLNEENQATITKYNGNVAVLNIPETLDGYTVVGIGDSVFQGNQRLQIVSIPDTVTEIGSGAFLSCSNLSDVTLSKSVKEIGSWAFGDCDALTAIEIPKSLENTYGSVFGNCDNLKTVTFETGVTKVVDCLFQNCTGLEKIVLPDTITAIGSSAFDNCVKLKEVELSSSTTLIGAYAFYGCKALERIAMPDSVTEIGGWAFRNCSNLSDVTLSKSVKEIGGSAFGDCDALTAIEIPKSLENTGDSVFENCDNLKTVTFETGVTKVVDCLFQNCTGLEKIVLPDTITAIGSSAFDNCVKLKEVELSSSTTLIEAYAFLGCKVLDRIEIPDSVTEIEWWAFKGCSNLSDVTLSKSIKSIENSTFQNCTSLTTIKIPDSVETIGSSAFENTGITEISLPAAVEDISSEAFRNCTALAKVEMGDKVTYIGSNAFQNCDALTAITIPDSVTTLGGYAFADCELLENVTLGNGLTEIDSYTFNLCPSLQKVVLPYRMTTVNSNAFTNCTKLTELTIPRATTSIGSNAFSYPAKMTVYGVSGTYAQEWADSVGAAFVNQEKPASAVSLNTDVLSLNEGDTANLAVSVAPADFTDEITWKSSDTSVATVSDLGLVTAKGVGTATIRVTAGKVSASCKVTVLQPVTGISLNTGSYSMEAKASYGLTATVYPDNANDKTVTWSSSDETVAAVNQDGVVTAIKKGTAVITVKAQDGSNVSKSCTITVTNNRYTCDTVEALESPHNYENNCTDVWTYTLSGEEKIAVTFDERTLIEDGFDYLYLYDAAGNEIGKYTGAELAGQTVILTGDTVKLKMDSDKSGNEWGFKVTKVEAYCQHDYDAAWSSDETYHWHAATCGHADQTRDKAEHGAGDWIVDSAATEEMPGSRHKECIVCGRVLETEEIPQLGKTPAQLAEERLNAAVAGALGASAGLSEETLTVAAPEEKQQAVSEALGQIQAICQEQNTAEVGLVPADKAIEQAAQLTAVESRINELLDTSVSVVHKDETQTFTLPTVENALLSVPAGESATIKVELVESPVFEEVNDQTVTAMTLELFNSMDEKLSLYVPVVVTLPIPETVDADLKVVIYHFREDGAAYAETIQTQVNREAGTVTFVTGSFSTFVIANAPDGVPVSGTVTSFHNEGAQVTVRLLDGSGAEAAQTIVTGNSVDYVLEGILSGDYTLEISKPDHVIRRYPVTVGSEAVTQDAEVWLIGDVNGDGKLNAKDKRVIYNHVAGSSVLNGYLFEVGDVNSDGKINAKDKKMIYNHVAGTELLWK